MGMAGKISDFPDSKPISLPSGTRIFLLIIVWC